MQQIIEQYFDFSVMFDSANFSKILHGFWFTVKLSILAGILSLTWGLVLAVLRQTPGKWGRLVRWPAIAYIDAFRGIPALLVIVLVQGSLGALSVENLVTGEKGPIPKFFGVPTWLGQPAPFWYGILALTLTYGAYMAEVYRAGIEAVPNGQMEAARSLGMNHRQAMRKVIVPQAVRKVIPPLLNDFISLTKDTTLVSVIGLIEVLQAAKDIQATSLNSSAITLAALLFLLITIPMARGVDVLIARQQAKYQRGLA